MTGDPTPAWQLENGVLTDADPTSGAVTLDAKTCACLVKMSLELSQDSASIEEIPKAARLRDWFSLNCEAGSNRLPESAGDERAVA